MHDVWEAWQVLSPRRNWISGMSAFPLPLSFEQIDCYARRFGFDDPDSFEELFFLLSRLDAVYIEDQNARSEKKNKNKKD